MSVPTRQLPIDPAIHTGASGPHLAGHRPRSHRRGRRRARALVRGMVGVVVGCVLAAALLVVTGALPLPAPGGSTSPLSPAPSAALAPSPPTAVDIAAIGVHSSLIGVGLNPDRTMATPSVHTPGQAAWYTHAPTPGATGPAVLVGHVNGDGHPGVFVNLARLRPGEEIRVTRADHRVAVFTVSHLDSVPKDRFPTDVVYGNTADPELRVITCGGVLDSAAHSYESNIIAYATLTSTQPDSTPRP